MVKEIKEKETRPLDRVMECWNVVVESLQVAEQHWEEMQELLLAIPRDEVQSAPIELQHAVTRFRRARFTVMLERFVNHYRAYGGLEAMKVKVKGEGS